MIMQCVYVTVCNYDTFWLIDRVIPKIGILSVCILIYTEIIRDLLSNILLCKLTSQVINSKRYNCLYCVYLYLVWRIDLCIFRHDWHFFSVTYFYCHYDSYTQHEAALFWANYSNQIYAEFCIYPPHCSIILHHSASQWLIGSLYEYNYYAIINGITARSFYITVHDLHHSDS